MTDDELICNFFKLVPLQDASSPSACKLELSLHPSPPAEFGLLVCKISWEGPHTPLETWVKVAEFPANPDPLLVRKNILKVLKQKNYFKLCNMCGEKKPTGWMEQNTCHSCMEKSGVTF